MSEYQRYEFRAVDRPLTAQQMSELRALSTRAVITRNSFTNTYNYGSFRGDPHKLMESYFDAHVYVSNWGTVTFMLRLPRTVLPDDMLAHYVVADGLEWWNSGGNTILEWRLEEEPRDEWMDGEGWMDQLLPIRDELARGDYRSVYIGWLSSITHELPDDENDDEEEHGEAGGQIRKEPPVPAGLKSLSISQVALAEFLGVDSDLLTAAEEASPEIPENDASDQGVVEWVARLPEQEVKAILVRLLRGEGPRIQAELQSQYNRADGEFTANSRSGVEGSARRTVAELLAAAARIAQERKQQALDERDRKRRAHLTGVASRFCELWATVRELAEEQKASSYQKICALLVDMRDAYIQAGRRAEYDAEFTRFLGQYARRTALMRRLKDARLMS